MVSELLFESYYGCLRCHYNHLESILKPMQKLLIHVIIAVGSGMFLSVCSLPFYIHETSRQLCAARLVGQFMSSKYVTKSHIAYVTSI